jgi:hypothetical protein
VHSSAIYSLGLIPAAMLLSTNAAHPKAVLHVA